MDLVSNRPDDYEVRPECAVVVQRPQNNDLALGKFGHRLRKKFSFEFFCRLVRPRIRRIHQF
jgi:hypothetical protein